MLTLSPNLDNYIILNPKLKDICNLYEAGNLLIFTDRKFYYDEELIQQANPQQLNHINVKKGKSQWFTAVINSKAYDKHPIYNFFPNDITKGRAFQKNILGFNNQIFDLVDKFFPKYDVVDNTQWTWRFTLTENENIHVDSYARGNHEAHSVRVFYNFDDQPRIWRVSYRVLELLKIYTTLAGPLNKLLHPNDINHTLNFEMNWEKFPYHQISIPPKALVLVNTQLVSHQIIWGRKLAAYSILVNPTTMVKPELNFTSQVRKFLNQQ